MTAVEFLIDKFKNSHANFINWADEYFEEAKELERQQIVMAFCNSKHSLCDEDTDLLYLAEEYYKAKFKQL